MAEKRLEWTWYEEIASVSPYVWTAIDVVSWCDEIWNPFSGSTSLVWRQKGSTSGPCYRYLPRAVLEDPTLPGVVFRTEDWLNKTDCQCVWRNLHGRGTKTETKYDSARARKTTWERSSWVVTSTSAAYPREKYKGSYTPKLPKLDLTTLLMQNMLLIQ